MIGREKRVLLRHYLEQGMPKAEIARHLKIEAGELDRGADSKAVRYGPRPRRPSKLDPYVQPSGARSWVQRLVIRGRRRDFGLGSVGLVSLAEAREKARANRKLAREGAHGPGGAPAYPHGA